MKVKYGFKLNVYAWLTLASFVEVKGKILEGIFEKRLTRFSAMIRIDGKTVQCFLPNPGRLKELLTPGARVVLKKSGTLGGRKTFCDIIGVYRDGRIVSVDSRVPNKLVFEALRNGDLPEFRGYPSIKPEHPYGKAKFDFLLSGGSGVKPCLLEVKSCTLVQEGVAMFPDAPTERGARHILELAKALDDGFRAAVLFVIQRDDAHLFKPNDETDPKFGKALREASSRGVEVYAYTANFTRSRIWLGSRVKVVL